MPLREKEIVFPYESSVTAVIFTHINAAHSEYGEPECNSKNTPENRDMDTVVKSDLDYRERNGKNGNRVRTGNRKGVNYQCEKPDAEYEKNRCALPFVRCFEKFIILYFGMVCIGIYNVIDIFEAFYDLVGISVNCRGKNDKGSSHEGKGALAYKGEYRIDY